MVDVENRIKILKQAVLEKDAEICRKEAHKIRGGAVNLTATPLAEAAKQMEKLAANLNFDELTENILNFENEFKRLKEFVS